MVEQRPTRIELLAELERLRGENAVLRERAESGPRPFAGLRGPAPGEEPPDALARVLAGVGRLLIPWLADLCTIFLESEGGALRLAAAAHTDGDQERRVRALCLGGSVRAEDEGCLTMRAWRTGESLAVAEYNERLMYLPSADAGIAQPGHPGLAYSLGITATMVHPLRRGASVFGVLRLDRTSSSARRWGADDLQRGERAAGLASLAVEALQRADASRRDVATRDELLAVVSHELRSPLAAIQVSAQSLARQQPPKAPEHQQLALILRAVQRVTRLTADLVQSAAVAQGGIGLDRRLERVASIFAELAPPVALLVAPRALRVEYQVAEDLPPIAADRERLLQVLFNLVGNAATFTPAGGWIRVAACREGEGVRVSVADSGPGIAAQDVPHVFERSWQRRRRRGQGLGLGLYIARAIVEAHGGRIWVEGPAGAGATVCFTVPAILESREASDCRTTRS